MGNFWETKERPIKGLGDWIEQRVTEPLGIKKAVEKLIDITGADGCGCEKRKQVLNDLVPFNKDKND